MKAQDVFKWCTAYQELEKKTDLEDGKKIIVSPSFVHIALAHSLLYKTTALLAAQDISIHEKGAHTGEVGNFQLKDFCRYSIVGHSERKEDLQTVKLKIAKCFEVHLIPIVCFKEIELAKKLYVDGAIMCWEDPANISHNGVFKPKNPKDVAYGFAGLTKTLPRQAKILYGGSVNGQNVKDLVNIDGLDGFLVGNASLDIESFAEILDEIH